MDIRRLVLYSALAIVLYSLWGAWQKDFPATTLPAISHQALNETNGTDLPSAPAGNANAAVVTNNGTSDTKSLIHVQTDVLSIEIDPAQGDITQAKLMKYPVSTEDPSQPIDLLYERDHEKYVANSTIFSKIGKSPKNLDFHFTSEQTSYHLDENQNELTVVLTGKSDDLQVRKTYHFVRGNYYIQVNYEIKNTGDQSWQGFMNTRLLRTPPKEESSGMFQVGSYTGASFSNPGQHRYKKVSFNEMAKRNLNEDATGGWIAMQQHYFLSAWIPAKDEKQILYTRASENEFSIGAVSQQLIIPAGSEKSIGSGLYLGPEDTAVLKNIAPGLELTVDYGWLWFVSSALFSLMKLIHSFVNNWGWSIVLVTVLIKLAFYKLSATSYKSMAGMRKLQPKLQALRERYGDDKGKISQATMELYRQEKVNPLGGCLPILIQIPVFIALYWVLIESVELRQAPFIFWIKDLAAADPWHILPIIMGGTMLIQQRLNPAPPDPMQAKVMMFLPVLFTGLFWNFPSGLVLYWIVNNTLSIVQQWYITRKYGDKPEGKKPRLAAVK